MMGNKSLKRTVAVLQSDFNELCVRFVMYVPMNLFSSLKKILSIIYFVI